MNDHQSFTLPPFSSIYPPGPSLPKQSPIHNFVSPLDARWWTHPTISEYDDAFLEMGIARRGSGGGGFECLSPVSMETVDPRWLSCTQSPPESDRSIPESMESDDEEFGEMGQMTEEEERETFNEEREMGFSGRGGGKKRPGSRGFP